LMRATREVRDLSARPGKIAALWIFLHCVFICIV
jgi:hypothetical protein